MRFCNNCERKFKLEDSLIVEVETVEPSGEGMFPWSELKNVMVNHTLCPHCESASHFGIIENMKEKRVIEISAEEILSIIEEEFQISAPLKPNSKNIRWVIKSEGDYDKGNFKEYLDKIIIGI